MSNLKQIRREGEMLALRSYAGNKARSIVNNSLFDAALLDRAIEEATELLSVLKELRELIILNYNEASARTEEDYAKTC